MKQDHYKKLMEGASSFNEWRDSNRDSEIEIDLSGADLGGFDLRKVNLREVNLFGANLSKADLSAVDLVYANLGESTLSGATLSGSNLTFANLQNADLQNANLFQASLSYACLNEANLSGADVSFANLCAADLGNACLIEANLSRATLCRANLCFAALESANLTSVDLCNSDLLKSNLRGSNLSEAVLFETDLRGANLVDANLSGADLRYAVFSTLGTIKSDGIREPQIIFTINIKADCKSVEHSIRLLENLQTALNDFVYSRAHPPIQYWKMPELYDFTFDLKPTGMETFDSIIAAAKYGWSYLHADDETIEFDRSAVWNRSKGVSLFIPEVSWACLMRFHHNPIISDKIRCELKKADLKFVNLTGITVNERTKLPADY
jgi:uncharacterized protein YjbI with pentapeptide repeats